ncbi:MAG: hypothetical protein CMB80_26265 [Flammeovirgaceae bacterium]|nr:hypothetical protein [Flammeovirgaceae bacterium]MBE63658.1 hypothetical protein [Flammeovirgaceae bacterium]MBR09900.1 hypothetical protein [Rickettsiales bacterium]|tara:strand:- start:83 stop:505 length:423 start_codon:yes stop_codon:yes gene_type:complete
MRVLASLFILFVGFGVVAQNADAEMNQNGPKIAFVESAYDFGEITQGDVVTHVFKYENTGNEALVISAVRTSCGCTAPDWNREPLAPGETTEMTIRFNSRGKMGMQNKIITITSNAVNSTERIVIKGNVKPATAEPEDGQ